MSKEYNLIHYLIDYFLRFIFITLPLYNFYGILKSLLKNILEVFNFPVKFYY